jgi:glycosyltransferase involved in cell wall biosynthesis
MDAAFRSFDLSGFDLVVSSNHACAKNVRTPAGALHICYCHTPMRYAWDPDFLEGEALGPVMRRVAPVATAWLRDVDRRRGAAPDVFVANSTFVATRIEQAYGRSSHVIHPPVEVAGLLEVERDPGDAYLVFGRLVPYKRTDVAIRACERLGRKLIVAGAGRDLERLRRLAPAGTEFLGQVPAHDLPGLFARARGLLFPGLEDFGIVPVEAQAAGLPVIAYGAGGVRDSVLDGRTGVLYEDGSVDGMCAAIERFEELSLDDGALRANATRFAPDRFDVAFSQLLDSLTNSEKLTDTLRTR